MLVIKNPLKYIEIIEHENHFYEFIFKHGTRLALQELFIYIEQIYQLPPEAQVKIILDTTKTSAPPIVHAFRLMQDVVRKYPKRPNPMRVVFLDNEKQMPMQRVMQTFIQLLNTNAHTIHLYGDKRTEAINFLFKDEPENHPHNSK